MKYRLLSAALLISGLLLGATTAAEARHHKRFYKAGPQVKGYVLRRGGYSYSYADSINTYGDSRSKYGGASAYRDPNTLDRQTPGGPFDHGFFFDSGMGSHGGNAPYMH